MMWRVPLCAWSLSSARADLFLSAREAQTIWLIRHGDKYSSYPDCETVSPGEDCFNKTLMGDNPTLTHCGQLQAQHVAKKLGNSNIKNLVVGPYMRTLQTALPLAETLDLPLKVEYALSESRQPEGPFREFNALAVEADDLKRIENRWDPDYGSFPIPTPESDELYLQRMHKAVAILRKRFPPSSGDAAFVSHATTSLSIAYGLCYGEDSTDSKLESFVNRQEGFGPAGVIRITRDAAGKCTSISQTDNSALESTQCGMTTKNKCEIKDFPDYYWDNSQGHGPANCH